MKRIILLALLVIAGTMIIWSQVPQAMNYKAVAKDDWGVALPNKTITLRFTILQGSETGAEVYQETHLTATNKFGLMDVEIGKGTPAGSSFDQIDWSTGVYYIQIEMDPNGGTNFRLEDTAHQLLSVPYALYAETSGSSNYAETDPFFISSPSSGIWESDIFNWNTAFGWGNHANEGYLKSFSESDPVFLLHPAHGIASDDINNWNAAYVWGNHADLYKPLSYVPVWGEIIDNPFNITSPEGGQLLKFNVATGKWENWTPDFLTEEIDESVTNEIQTLSIQGSQLSISEGNTVSLPVYTPLGEYYYLDKDHDGLGNPDCPVWVPESVAPPMYHVNNSGDCADDNPFMTSISPEICDGLDNDCDGQIDEDFPEKNSICYVYGVPGILICDPSDPFLLICSAVPPLPMDMDNDGFTSDVDCNDNDPSIYPGANEVFDGKDNDCNGLVDEGYVCPPSSYEPNESCSQSSYLGQVADAGEEVITRTGNATGPNDVDWFWIMATDESNIFSESFKVRINLVSNPGGAFVFDVYKSNCSSPVANSATEYVEEGTLIIDDTNSYYIKVYLLHPSQPSDCINYTLRMSNGEE